MDANSQPYQSVSPSVESSLRVQQFLISGRVQGVFYRQTMMMVARQLGIKGWCRNLPDGRVEAIAIGDQVKLGKLAEWCQEGPPDAVVQSVEITAKEEVPVDIAAEFEVRR